MIGQVTTWKMTEEERLAYIEKHPIKSNPDLKRQSAFVDIANTNKSRSKKNIDWKWRSQKGVDGRYGKGPIES